MVGMGCQDKRKLAYLNLFWLRDSKKNQLPRHNSLCTSRSHRSHFSTAKVHIGFGLGRTSAAEETVIFAKKKKRFLYCETIVVVSDLNFEFYNEERVK